MDLNSRHLKQYQAMLSAYAESHRRVGPVINTCLDNITAASEAVVPETVCSRPQAYLGTTMHILACLFNVLLLFG